MTAATWQDPVNGYRKYADTSSFADNLLWVEAFKQIDGYRISTYFHKTRAGKITALPTWDYNLAAGNSNYLAGENPAGWYYAHLGGGDIGGDIAGDTRGDRRFGRVGRGSPQ